ncbi:hypothetical protein BJ138DRAFT_221832 [Hygrophoropsis aurantiaca]|uniref:Uncharacterized protein n=1 Tax=Hygrophoropsis aurantiaca TaxID=72124 RepID=A0ACB8APU7_9AGAM|nr:hypothetical protein BJ138DRAFT_221832 [Hygrophoropsis aurantiaca]
MKRYNGFGGKVEAGETPAEAALRELKEEAGIEAPLQHAGTLVFVDEGSEWAFQIEMFSARTYSGIPTETEEMRPEWFALPSLDEGTHSRAESDPANEFPPIPYHKMWEDDIYWMPVLAKGQPFVGRADFKKSGENLTLAKWWFATVENES